MTPDILRLLMGFSENLPDLVIKEPDKEPDKERLKSRKRINVSRKRIYVKSELMMNCIRPAVFRSDS